MRDDAVTGQQPRIYKLGSPASGKPAIDRSDQHPSSRADAPLPVGGGSWGRDGPCRWSTATWATMSVALPTSPVANVFSCPCRWRSVTINGTCRDTAQCLGILPERQSARETVLEEYWRREGGWDQASAGFFACDFNVL